MSNVECRISNLKCPTRNPQLATPNPIQLIVNGDDFGKSEEVNEAIVRAFQAGTLTSASLMVTGDAFDHAVHLARENPDLAVGLHLLTVQAKSVLPHSEIPSIVDKEGNFARNPGAAGLKYQFSGTARRHLVGELAAQFQKFHTTGLGLSHVDSHLHMHVHPVIFAAALELAEQWGVRCMRVPQDDFRLAVCFERMLFRDPDPLRLSLSKGGWGNAAGKAIEAFVFRLLTRRMKKLLLERGFSFAEQVYGHLYSGRMTLDYAFFVLDHLSARTNEIYFHPAVFDRGMVSDPRQHQGAGEFAILISDEFRKRVQDPRIHLTNYSGLVSNA
jgi:chitin disaccharide deacetylase